MNVWAAEMPEPSRFARILERLMVWHDPQAEAERAARYEATRRRAVQSRMRAEVILNSYGHESHVIRSRRRR